MIWENNVSLVLMLTRFQEKRILKAHQYWPEEIGQEIAFDELIVRLESISEQIDDCPIAIRKFCLSCGDQQRIVTHAHYTEWPDHGVPATTANILALIRLIEETMKADHNPILIHCSAGIGRTGTIIALHIYLQKYQQLRNPKKISIYDIVEQMRHDRMGMVQTRDQYVFLHNAVNDLIEKLAPKFDPVSPRKRLYHSMTLSPKKIEKEETLAKLTRLRSLSSRPLFNSCSQLSKNDTQSDPGTPDPVTAKLLGHFELPSSTDLTESIGVVYGPDDDQI